MLATWWYKIENRQLGGVRAIYWNSFIRSFVSGILGIFFPIYVFLLTKEAFGSWILGAKWMMVYLVCLRVVVAVFSIPVGKLIERWGFRKSILLATVIDVLAYVFIMMAKSDWRWILVSGVLSGIGVLFYWLPRMSIMAGDGKKESYGKQVGGLALVDRGAEVLGPVVGGVLITLLGFEWVFVIAMVILMLSAVPLFFMEHHHHSNGVGWGEFRVFLGKKEYRGDFLAFVGRAIDDAVMTWMWPLFMFLVIGNFERMGLVASGTLLASVLATFIAGKAFDKLRKEGQGSDVTLFRVSSVVTAVARVARSLSNNVFSLALLEGGDKVVAPFYWVPFDSYLYTAAKRFSPVAYFVFREIIYSLGRLLAVVLVILFLDFANPWPWILGLGSIGVLMSLPMSKESKK